MPEGARFLGIAADARNTAEVDAAVARAAAELGTVDCLVNVVGGTQPGTWRHIEELPDDVFDDVLALNLRAGFVAARAVARRLFEADTQGSIVNLASVSGLVSAPYHGAYGAAKAGVVALTRTMAVEWGGRGVRVNCVAPGRIETPRTRGMGKLGSREPEWNPLRRDADAAEVAAPIAFLLSDLASGITGQTLTVDAGVTARSPFGSLDEFAVRLRTEPSD